MYKEIEPEIKPGLKILAIETSCDETGAAIIEDGRHVLANSVYTQIEFHKEYGGVVPEIASRKHVEKVDFVIDAALEEAEIKLTNIDAIACTCGPGLVGALLCGVSSAKAMAFALHKPLIGVNHIEGHICANYITHPELEPPFICLVVSGGHTHIVEVVDYCEYRLIGCTRDDAAGEAFDKVARVMGLGYPGGPKVEALAREASAPVHFKTPIITGGGYDFSFSGIKTGVMNWINQRKQHGEQYNNADVAAGFQNAVVEALVSHTTEAACRYNYKTVVMAGGVACNGALRAGMEDACTKNGIKLYYPAASLCTDNAAMIGAAGYYRIIRGEQSGLDLNAQPGLKLFKKEIQ